MTTFEYDIADRPIKTTDDNGVSFYTWYDEYGRKEYAAEARPPGAYTLPVVLAGVALPDIGGWHMRDSLDLAGNITRSQFLGNDGRSTEDGILQVVWKDYDFQNRPARTHTAIFNGYVPGGPSAGDSASRPESPPQGLTFATSEVLYDEVGRVWRSIDPEQRTTDVSYDSLGRVESSYSPVFNGTRDVTTSVFDDLGRLTSQQRTIHDPEGQPFDQVLQQHYDPWSRVRRSIGDPAGENLITDYGYDSLGRATDVVKRWNDTPPSLPTLEDQDRVQRVEYDLAGRVEQTSTRESVANWIVTGYSYDRDGLVTALIDPRGNETSYTYDALGRVERVKFPTADDKTQTIEYTEYESPDRPTTVEYRADDSDTAVRVTRGFTYDPWGRLEERSALIENSDGTLFMGTVAQRFAYDDLGRLVTTEDESPTAEFSGMELVVVEQYWDSANRLVRDYQQLAGLDGVPVVNREVSRAYDHSGFRESLTYPDSGQASRYNVTFAPDSRGRLATISAPSDQADPGSSPAVLAEYRYWGNRVWSREYPTNGTILKHHGEEAEVGGKSLKLDLLGRVREARTVLSSDPEEVISHFALGFNRVGDLAYEQRRHEPTSLTPEYRTRAMTTDLAGRLKNWAEGGLPSEVPILPTETDPASIIATPTAEEDWLLDVAGNWSAHSLDLGGGAVSESYDPANPLNQYTSTLAGQETHALTHDWLGQLRVNEEREHQYAWDVFGRLTEIRNPLTSTVVERFRYDATNRRIERQVLVGPVATDAITRFTYDGWRTIEERAVEIGVEVVRARYGFGNGLDETLWMDRDVARSGGVPDPIAGAPSGDIEARFFVHRDSTENAEVLTENSDGTIVERYAYTTYGQIQVWADSDWSVPGGYPLPAEHRSQVQFPYLYSGQRFDAETQLHYFKNRFYDALVGRFLQRDLIGYADGPNLYQYGNSNPSVFRDSLGLSALANAQAKSEMAAMVASARERQAVMGATPGADPKPSGHYRMRSCSVGVQWRSCERYAEAYHQWASGGGAGPEPKQMGSSSVDDGDQPAGGAPECSEDNLSGCGGYIEVKAKGSLSTDDPVAVKFDYDEWKKEKERSETSGVTLVARPLQWKWANSFNHASLFVTDPETGEIIRQYSLQGGNTEFDPQLSELAPEASPSSTFTADRDAFLNPGGSN